MLNTTRKFSTIKVQDNNSLVLKSLNMCIRQRTSIRKELLLTLSSFRIATHVKLLDHQDHSIVVTVEYVLKCMTITVHSWAHASDEETLDISFSSYLMQVFYVLFHLYCV